MRIQCPDCAARYEVPDDRVQAGRTVRCARCGRDWLPLPAVPANAPAPVEPAPEPTPVVAAATAEPPVEPSTLVEAAPAPRPAHPFMAPPRGTAGRLADADRYVPEPARESRAGLVMAWVASLLVLVVVGWTLVQFRGPVVRAFPPSQRAYDALGLAVPGEGGRAPAH